MCEPSVNCDCTYYTPEPAALGMGPGLAINKYLGLTRVSIEGLVKENMFRIPAAERTRRDTFFRTLPWSTVGAESKRNQGQGVTRVRAG